MLAARTETILSVVVGYSLDETCQLSPVSRCGLMRVIALRDSPWRPLCLIKDAASAALMVIKADCLHNAGVISEGEKQWVHSRARPFLADGTLKDAA